MGREAPKLTAGNRWAVKLPLQEARSLEVVAEGYGWAAAARVLAGQKSQADNRWAGPLPGPDHHLQAAAAAADGWAGLAMALEGRRYLGVAAGWEGGSVLPQFRASRFCP